jgi:branched-chain amino acid transport system substrate-binding protein
MHRMPNRTVVPVVAAVFCLFAIACSEGAATDGETVTFGVAAPTARSFGEGAVFGAKLAAREINASGGIEGKTKIEILAVDDGGEAETAVPAALQIANNPEVLAVVGHANSGPMLGAARIYNENKLVALGTSATSTEIAEAGPWIFRIASSDSANAVEIARQARGFGQRIGILYANDSYGRGLARVFEDALAATDTRIVGYDPYMEEMKDFRPYLQRLKSRGAEVLLVAGLEVGAATLIRQMHEMGLNARVIGGDGLESLVEMEGDHDGTLVGMLFHPDASENATRFAAAYREAYGREPESSAATAYDAVYLLARAVAAGATDRDAIRRYLDNVGRDNGSAPFDGVAGTIRFDERGEPMGKPFVIAALDNGRFRLVKTGS